MNTVSWEESKISYLPDNEVKDKIPLFTLFRKTLENIKGAIGAKEHVGTSAKGYGIFHDFR